MTVIRRDPARIAARAMADLVTEKEMAITSINELVGKARQKYITTAPGQEMIYIAKEAEAKAWLKDLLPDPAAYPLLSAEVGVTAPTTWELAQIWVNVAVYWRGIAAQIEGARMRAIVAIEQAADTAQIAAIRAAFRPL